MKFYHATTENNFWKIMSSHKIKPGYDGVVYLTKTPQDAVKFLYFRAVAEKEIVYVIEVDLPESKVVETFDHSYEFFKCKSYGYPDDIKVNIDDNRVWKYDIDQ